MKTAFALILFFILRDFHAEVLAKQYEEAVEGLNPLLRPLLDPEAGRESGTGDDVMDSLINRILLNKDPRRPLLWVELVRGKTQYSFFFDRSWDPLSAEDMVVQRKADKAFAEYRRLGDQALCRKVSSASMAKYEERFRNKLVNFMAGLVEHKQKSQLYQLLPSGSFNPDLSPQFLLDADLQGDGNTLLARALPFISCLQFHTEIQVATDDEGFFLRFWNWLRSLFGLKPKKPISEQPDDVLESHVRRQMQPDGTEAHSSTFATKADEYAHFIRQLADQGTQNLRNYRENLRLLFDLMVSPNQQMGLALSTLFLKHRAEGRFDAEYFRQAAAPIFIHLLELNCNEGPGHCLPDVRPEALMAFERVTRQFSEALTDSTDLVASAYAQSQAFVFGAYQAFLHMLSQIDETLAAQSLKAFWQSHTGHSRVSSQLNNADIAARLETMIPTDPTAMGNGRVIGLVHETLAYLPPTGRLAVPNWMTLFTGFFAETSVAFGLESLRAGGSSKILLGEPVGPAESLDDYYSSLSELMVQCLRQNPGAEADFPALFDTFLDAAFAQNSPAVVSNYPLLKIHNLWAARKESQLPRIAFAESLRSPASAEHRAEWSRRFLQTSEQAPLRSFLRGVLTARGLEQAQLTDDQVWENLETMTWTEAEGLSPVLGRLLNGDEPLLEDPEKLAQLI